MLCHYNLNEMLKPIVLYWFSQAMSQHDLKIIDCDVLLCPRVKVLSDKIDRCHMNIQ